MDDSDDPSEDRAPAAPAPSKTSSWITLGFLLGAATVWAYLRNQEKPVPPAPPTLTAWPVKKQVERAPLTNIEAVFAKYQDLVIWDKNTTEVVMWRDDTRDFSEFYEVKRAGDDFYFRSIPHWSLHRRLFTHGKPLGPEVPLRFSETEDQYREWLEHGRYERSEDATLQPTLLGPAVVPAGETMPRPKAPKAKVEPAPAPTLPGGIKPPVDIKPNE